MVLVGLLIGVLAAIEAAGRNAVTSKAGSSAIILK
jgi:hypothetical protein